jgi:antibiotic biosynthesis monooxygenase (ABM) superfamily enzyme
MTTPSVQTKPISHHAEHDILFTHLHIRSDAENAFAAWQAKLNGCIASFDDFVSLEILSSPDSLGTEWTIIQRFGSQDSLKKWHQSQERHALFEEATLYLDKGDPNAIKDDYQPLEKGLGGVTEVFVTHVLPNQVAAYREWIGKMHQAESKFPGFRRTFVQPPKDEKEGSWITLLQFDTPEHLDQWLNSAERQAILKEGKSFIHSLESHHVVSGFSGWFAERSDLAQPPAAWKQTMLVLLVIFPIVMMEIKYLNPLTKQFSTSIATFIGNAISVALVSWPTIPIAIYFLGWWLKPHKPFSSSNLLGIGIVCLLYLIEIILLSFLI